MSANGRIAVVTGAGSGIGRASAVALQGAGYAVVLAGRREAELEKTASMGQVSGPDMRIFPTDVTMPDSVDALFGAIYKEYRHLDVLFNNAGVITSSMSIEDISYEMWSEVVATNITGAFLCAQAAFRLMKAQQPRGGRIINNGSISAISPRPNQVPYTAAKHAITGLTKCISLDGRKYDIACSQIDIGNAATDMTDQMSKGALQADGTLRPEPLMDLRHVSDAVVYIANLPLEANVQFMTLMATKAPLVGRG